MNKPRLLQRLFRRSKPEIEWSPNWWYHFMRRHRCQGDDYSVYWHCIGEDLEKHPEMCRPDLPARLTAHLTRAIEIPTALLPALDEYGQTEAVETPQYSSGYDDPTVAVRRVDVNATMPMALEEILRR